MIYWNLQHRIRWRYWKSWWFNKIAYTIQMLMLLLEVYNDWLKFLICLMDTGWWEIDIHPDSKVHGANMGPIWGRQDPGGLHVGPMNFVIWAWLSFTCARQLYQFAHARIIEKYGITMPVYIIFTWSYMSIVVTTQCKVKKDCPWWLWFNEWSMIFSASFVSSGHKISCKK